MFSGKKINIYWYFIGTIINISGALYSLGPKFTNVVMIFMLAIMANQFLLYAGLKELFDKMQKNEKSKKGVLYIVLKIFFLGGAFIYASQSAPEKIFLFTLFYIFQLIILVLSIKRENKKN